MLLILSVNMQLPRICCFLFVLTLVECTLVNGPSPENSFKQCLISQPVGSFGYCMGVGAISKLQSWDNEPEFDLVDGFTLSRDEKQFRQDPNFFMDRDPSDFRSIIDTFGQVLSRRSMKWDMDWIHPGLLMRVGPSSSPGGQLEFALDPHREALNQHSLKEASTGRILARQFLVPLLLGFKFNIATIVPIVFGILALIAKKAVILSKVALIASSALGLGSLLLGGAHNKPQYGHFNPAFGGHAGLGGHHSYRYPEEDYIDPVNQIRGTNDYNDDQVRLYANFKRLQTLSRDEQGSGRNFAWGEDVKDPNKA